MEQRGFKGVWIPKEIWLNTELSWSEKGLLVEIDSLNTSNGCWATNKHFSEFLGISENRVSHLISNLKEKGYIKVFIKYRDGTKQIEKRVCSTARSWSGSPSTAMRSASNPLASTPVTPARPIADGQRPAPGKPQRPGARYHRRASARNPAGLGVAGSR